MACFHPLALHFAAALRGCSGAADTEEEAHARADALVHAGVVLRFNGIVYLKPQEVSELVYRVSNSSSSRSTSRSSSTNRDIPSSRRSSAHAG
jgi:hypothetical protein